MSSIKTIINRKLKKIITKQHELNYLFWECTTRCNLNCLHCGSDCSKDSNYKDMPLNDFLKALDTITEISSDFNVVITGGEPLLRKDLEQCGYEIRKRGMHWGIVSNGYFYTKERQNSLLNAGMGALTISLDGLQNSHNWLRNNKNSFKRAIKAIEIAAKSQRLNFDVVTCLNKHNFSELNNIYNLLLDKNVKAWRLFTIAPIGRAKYNPDMFLSNTQFKNLMDFITKKRKLKQIDIKFSCEGYVGNYEFKVRDSLFFCRAGINIGSILIDGSISACPNIDRNFTQGNIYKDNFYDIWKTKFQEFRNRDWLKTGICKTCNKFNDCNGNGFHYREKGNPNVLVCHYNKLKTNN